MKKLHIDYNMIRLGEEIIEKNERKSYWSSVVDHYLDQAWSRIDRSPPKKKKKTINKRNIRIKLCYQLLELDPNVSIW